MPLLTFLRRRPLQLRHSFQYTLPDLLALDVSFVQHRVGQARCLQRRTVTMLSDQNSSGAVDVEVGGHGSEFLDCILARSARFQYSQPEVAK